MGERLVCNQEVGGSIPLGSSEAGLTAGRRRRRNAKKAEKVARRAFTASQQTLYLLGSRVIEGFEPESRCGDVFRGGVRDREDSRDDAL